MIIDLRIPDLRKVEVRTEVITSKGFKFKLLVRLPNGKENWYDKTSGLIWHDIENKKYTHYEAVETFGDRLPTKEEFEIAETHGFREVLPNVKERYFWSYSVLPTYILYVFDFSGTNGRIDSDYRGIDVDIVRTISRTKTSGGG